jgi:phosphoenolpyruvate-protein phosphotransferase/dihydroxyacetone kinase phosphotransfer subunit
MTVGLVIVSHSAQLARGVVELAGQMTQGKVPMMAAGGAGEGVLGTSADTILQAIQSIDTSDGVLVLLDLGSAVLSAEMALEMLDEKRRSFVQLSTAPLVEGAIAAALEASLGRTLVQVSRAAEQIADSVHLRQLKPLSQPTAVLVEEQTPSMRAANIDVIQVKMQVTNPSGLHARPASLFVQTAARFQSSIRVARQDSPQQFVDATSILGVLSLGIRKDDTILLRISGPDATESLSALQELVKADFYENPALSPPKAVPASAQTAPSTRPPLPIVPQTAVPAPPLSANSWQGISASAGVALGPAFLLTTAPLALDAVEQRTVAPEQVTAEQQRLREALHAASAELHALAQQLKAQIGDDAAIFDAQALMLNDPALLNAALQLIERQHLDAASALAQVGEQQARGIAQLPDPLLAARAADIRDAVGRAIRHLRPQVAQVRIDDMRQPSLLIAHDLTPSETAQLRPEMVLAICTVQGSPTAHAAILARALGIPALVGLPAMALQVIQPGQEVGLDATHGLLYVSPSAEIRGDLIRQMKQQREQQAALQAQVRGGYTPISFGQRRVHLLANIGSVAEAEAARQWGAEGIGLLRTEFLLANATVFPDEQEQRRLYAQVFRAFLGDKSEKRGPVVARTLDAGADKPMAALQALIGTATEANPALGVRGIRIHLAHPDLLEQQIRALLLAAVDTGVDLHVIVPMITTLEELQQVRTIVERAYTDLQQRQVALPAHVPLGIMVEVPAAALIAPELATLADFFSIGANDLLQYTLACDRTNAALGSLYNPMQPSVLRLIRMIATAGRQAGKLVAVCGEMASDALLAPLLVGLGVDKLSMVPTALPAVHASLTGCTIEELVDFADRACHMATKAEVEALCQEFQRRKG